MVMEFMDLAVMGIMAINAILAIVLIGLFSKSYMLIKSKINLGLLFFALAFLLQSLTSLYFYQDILSKQILGTTMFSFAVNILELIGLLFLLYVATR